MPICYGDKVADHETHEADAVIRADKPMPIQSAEFVLLQLNLGDLTASTPVIDIRRGAAMVTVRWPASAAAEGAAWLQEWLR